MGDPSVLMEQCLSFQRDILNFAFKLTYDAELSEEIAQETYARAIRGIGGFKGRSELKTWLFAIVKNEAFRRIRRKKKDIEKLAELRARENARQLDSIEDRHETAACVEQVKNGCLLALLSCLPFSQRAAFILVELNNIPIRSAAKILGRSENATRLLLMRAKSAIKGFLCGVCERVSVAPRCRCANMLNFSLKNGLIPGPAEAAQIEAAKLELRRLRDEIELMRTLPDMESRIALKLGPKLEIVFSNK